MTTILAQVISISGKAHRHSEAGMQYSSGVHVHVVCINVTKLVKLATKCLSSMTNSVTVTLNTKHYNTSCYEHAVLIYFILSDVQQSSLLVQIYDARPPLQLIT